MKKAFILSATRTPFGSFGGVFTHVSATDLGAAAIRGAITKAEISPEQIDEVYMGNVISANLGQAPARQAAIKAGISDQVPCTTINKVCASGTKAIILAAQAIQLGLADVVIAGGMENMTRIPHYIPQVRFGSKLGDGTLIDGLLHDGLTDAYSQSIMGVCADQTAERYQFSRKDQDEYAIRSYKRAKAATEKGWFKNEITPVEVPQRKGDPLMIDTDEEIDKVDFKKIPSLRPAFSKEGTVTAANASTINDGASALIIVSEKFLEENKKTPVAEIISYADAAHDPQWFTTAPTKAAPIALARAGIRPKEIDIWEVNEAFAVVPMVFAHEMGIKDHQINILGGAISLGHPLGASGARIVTTLINALNIQDKNTGCATICNGGGGASALVIRRTR